MVPAALLRVRPQDFGLAAKIDPAYPYVKVALIISLYVGAIATGGGGLRRQSGGVAAFATSLKKDVVDKIGADASVRGQAETFLKDVLRHYAVDQGRVYAKAWLAPLDECTERPLPGDRWPQSAERQGSPCPSARLASAAARQGGDQALGQL